MRRLWQGEREPRPGASSTAIAALEEQLRVVLPTELREYLATVDGMHSGAWVGNEIEFWPIERILEESDQWKCFEPGIEGTLLPFADFLINSHAYAIRVCSPDARVFLVTGSEYRIECASSFDEFVDLYERDDPKLYG